MLLITDSSYSPPNYHNIGKCSDPLTLANDGVIVDGYEDPALEGKNITFNCPSGLMMIGPNSVTCMGNGEWKPDPREVKCAGEPVTVGCHC